VNYVGKPSFFRRTTVAAKRPARELHHRDAADAPFGHWRTQTFIAGLRVDEFSALRVVDGPMNPAAFDTCIDPQLSPELPPGDMVIADNLSSYRSAKVQAVLPDMLLIEWLLL
jgi:hypothetical protein